MRYSTVSACLALFAAVAVQAAPTPELVELELRTDAVAVPEYDVVEREAEAAEEEEATIAVNEDK